MDLLLGTLLLRLYVLGFLAAFVAAGAADLGWRRTVLIGAWMWAVAWLAEFSSTRTGVPFGLYHYTGLPRGMYFGVPVSNFLGWLVVGTVGVSGYLAMAGSAAGHGRASRYTTRCLASTWPSRRGWPSGRCSRSASRSTAP